MSEQSSGLAATKLTEQLPTTTVDLLADTLKVSGRTVRRDLATLREQGLVITGESGRGGGLRLEGDRGVTSVHLSLEEVVSLWLAARLSQRTSTLPWSTSASTALTKLLASLPHSRSRALTSLCRRVIIGPTPTTRMLESLGEVPREALAVFETCFTSRTAMAFDYRGREGRASSRRVEPHGLLVQGPLWYVLAFDLDARAPRMFRIDRLSKLRRLPSTPFEPRRTVIDALLEPGFDWQPLMR